MGWPSWLSTPPIPTPEASQATSNIFEKSRSNTEEHWSSFYISKCFTCSFSPHKFSFIKRTCYRVHDSTKSSYEPPIKRCQSVETSLIARIFPGSAWTPCVEMTKPKNVTCLLVNVHFLKFMITFLAARFEKLVWGDQDVPFLFWCRLEMSSKYATKHFPIKGLKVLSALIKPKGITNHS